jgi:hypothetical protein
MAALVLGGVSVEEAASAGTSPDLRQHQGTQIIGAPGSRAGEYVGPAGDVNGDGIPDLLVGACGDSRGPFADDEGSLYVVFGQPEPFTVQLDQLGDKGFEIRGADPGDAACTGSSLGDLNGDGLDDIVVGASFASNNNRTYSGTAYVIWGKKSTETVDLKLLDLDLPLDLGFRIDGAYPDDSAGRQLANAGDVNGDGLPDLIVGAPIGGRAYVVFGRDSSENVDLRQFDRGTQGDQGYRIITRRAETYTYFSVANAGDVDGDGIPDVVVGVIHSDNHPGSVYVVFGKDDPEEISTLDLKGHGFKIRGEQPGDEAGASVAGLGDVNGDGLDDVIIGAPRSLSRGVRGKAYVVFGKSNTRRVSLSKLEGKGFKVRGVNPSDDAAAAVSDVGDVDGDGKEDVLIGVRFADPLSRTGAGSVFLILGRERTDTIKLRKLGNTGMRIDGAHEFDGTGWGVAGVGDMNGDGVPDMAIGAPQAGESRSQGKVYLLWGTR